MLEKNSKALCVKQTTQHNTFEKTRKTDDNFMYRTSSYNIHWIWVAKWAMWRIRYSVTTRYFYVRIDCKQFVISVGAILETKSWNMGPITAGGALRLGKDVIIDMNWKDATRLSKCKSCSAAFVFQVTKKEIQEWVTCEPDTHTRGSVTRKTCIGNWLYFSTTTVQNSEVRARQWSWSSLAFFGYGISKTKIVMSK